MTITSLTDEQTRRARAAANGLGRPVTAPGPAGVADAVRRFAGVQAQSWRGAAHAVRARSAATTRANVDTARESDRSVVRGWYMRGTLQLIAAEDAAWMLQALGPPMVARSTRRYAELGLTESTRTAAARLLERALSDRGPSTRSEIGGLLVHAKLIPDATGQAPYALLRYAGLTGRVCYGPDRSGEETWVATRDWSRPKPLSDDASALRELCRRYLLAYGPATPHDFASWSGLSVPTARAAFGAQTGLVEVEVSSRPAAMLGALDTVATGVRLLGEFDPYLLGYTDRALVVEAANARKVHPGGGMLRPTIVTDGRAIGTWRPDRSTGAVELELFEPGSHRSALTRALDAESADVARFDATPT